MNQKEKDFLQEIEKMPTNTKAQKERKANALRHLHNVGDDGRFGKVAEILSKSNGSKAKNYAKQGKADCFVWIEDENGKRHRYNAECKTNGGRISSLRGKNAPKFVVYSMDLCNSTTKGKRRVVEPKVMRTEFFLDLLDSLGATKRTNGTNDEEAIQPSNKGLYLAMLDYPVTYDQNETYFESDFDVE